MKAKLLLFASSIGSNDKDTIFNAWCSEVGISCPGADVRSTPESVAGRGVFSTKDLSIGEEVISIPHYAALKRYVAGAIQNEAISNASGTELDIGFHWRSRSQTKSGRRSLRHTTH